MKGNIKNNKFCHFQDYRLDFGYWAKRWKGCVATIVPEPDSHVWGAVWEIDVSDIPNLDRYINQTISSLPILLHQIAATNANLYGYRQEGVVCNIYEVIEVTVETPNSETLRCRCYQLCKQPEKIPEGEPVPEKRKPSLLYLNVILKGAIESQLPEYYIDQLRKIEHNGWAESDIQQIMMIEN